MKRSLIIRSQPSERWFRSFAESMAAGNRTMKLKWKAPSTELLSQKGECTRATPDCSDFWTPLGRDGRAVGAVAEGWCKGTLRSKVKPYCHRISLIPCHCASSPAMAVQVRLHLQSRPALPGGALSHSFLVHHGTPNRNLYDTSHGIGRTERCSQETITYANV